MKMRPAFFSAIALIAFAASANAQWTQWTTASGGNGHCYRVVINPNNLNLTWDEASVAAQAMGGYLATLTSEQENNFVFGLADDPIYWKTVTDGRTYGPWLGGSQPAGSSEPDGGWEWVNGEGVFGFTAWGPGEPNDVKIPANQYLGEESLHFWGLNSTRSAAWNDLHTADFEPGIHAFVVERNCVPDLGSTFGLLLAALGGLGLLKRRAIG